MRIREATQKTVAIYPGRFHPFHKGHASVYNFLKSKFDTVYITTSNKIDPPKSPFSFEEKRAMMIHAGIPASAIVQTRQPYIPIEILKNFDPQNTSVVFAVSQKDMDEDPRFAFKPKKDGSPSYFQPAAGADMEGLDKHGYVMVAPTLDFTVLGEPMRSATELRRNFAKADDETQKRMITDLYGAYDEDIHNIMRNKIKEHADPYIEHVLAAESVLQDLTVLYEHRSFDMSHVAENAQKIIDRINTIPVVETLDYLDPNDPMDSIVAVPGVGTMSIRGLMSNIKDKMSELADKAGSGQPSAFRDIKYRMDSNIIGVMVDALANAFDEIETIRRKGGASSKGIPKDVFDSVMHMHEAWSAKYKRSINCNNPKGFSQRAHCAGRKKKTNEDVPQTSLFQKFPTMKAAINNFYSTADDVDFAKGAFIETLSEYTDYHDDFEGVFNYIDNIVDRITKAGYTLEELVKEQGIKEDVKEEVITEYVFQSIPLRVLDNLAGRKDNRPFPIKTGDTPDEVFNVTPDIARKFMNLYYQKEPEVQKAIDKTLNNPRKFIELFTNIMSGKKVSGAKVADIAPDKMQEFKIVTPDAKDTMGIARKDMPQVNSADYPEFLEYLRDAGAKFTKETVPAKSLRAIQGEFSEKGVEKQLNKYMDGAPKKPVIASSDDYIIDGHHRWLVATNTGDSVEIFRVNMPGKQLLDLVNAFPKVTYKDIYTEGYKLQLERGDDMDVLHITDTKTGQRTEVRGKPNYETQYDAEDKLHQLLDKIGKAANISELINGEPVGINPKHPDGSKSKAATTSAFNESAGVGIINKQNTTADVKPGETERQSKKLGLGGKPKLLHKKAAKNSTPNKLFNLGIAEIYTPLAIAIMEGGHSLPELDEDMAGFLDNLLAKKKNDVGQKTAIDQINAQLAKQREERESELKAKLYKLTRQAMKLPGGSEAQRRVIDAMNPVRKALRLDPIAIPEGAEITMWTNPEYQGSDVDDEYYNKQPAKLIDVNKLTPFEPADKMDDEISAANMNKLVKAIQAGEKINPIVVVPHKGKLLIIDGHHRYFATIKAGVDKIRAVMADPKNLTWRDDVPDETATLSQEDVLQLKGTDKFTKSSKPGKHFSPHPARGMLVGIKTNEAPTARDSMNLDADKLQQSIDYFYTTHAPKNFGSATTQGNFKGLEVVTFTKGSDTLMFLVNNDDQAVFYVMYSKFDDGVAIGNVRSNGTVKATEVYAYLVDKFGTLYSDDSQTPQGSKIWTSLAKFYPNLDVKDAGGRFVATLAEAVSQVDIDQLERFADKMFAKVGIDVEFGKHFMDRVNDTRNGKPITPAELTRLFKQEYKRYGKPIAQMGPEQQAVMKDLQTDINIPFMLQWDDENNELDLIAKTVMRKKDFKTSNREFAVERGGINVPFASGMIAQIVPHRALKVKKSTPGRLSYDQPETKRKRNN